MPQAELSGRAPQTPNYCLKHRTWLKGEGESSPTSAVTPLWYQPLQGFRRVPALPKSCKGILCESRTLEGETGYTAQLPNRLLPAALESHGGI